MVRLSSEEILLLVEHENVLTTFYYYKPNIPIAVIEAKDNKHNNGDGI